jgi:hypothetical protein
MLEFKRRGGQFVLIAVTMYHFLEPEVKSLMEAVKLKEEAAQDAFVVGYGVGATALRLMDEKVPFGQGPEGCPR